MAYLAILGHPTRGKEVIEILEMLGGKNIHNYGGTFNECYAIDNNKICTIYTSVAKIDNRTIFTLEQFEEKFPYKVGDEVEYKSIGDANLKSKIIYMEWCNSLNKVLYTTEDAHVISTEDIIETKAIPPYMDYDIKEGTEKNYLPKTQAEVDKYLQEHSVKNGMNVTDIEHCLEMDGLKLPENVVINSKGIGSIQFIQWYEKLQYPKTYEECCEVLVGRKPKPNEISFDKMELCLVDLDNTQSIDFQNPYLPQLNSLFRLRMCRDAYWKIAGEQMGLGKPWKPDWNNVSDKHCIYFVSGEIWLTECQTRQCTLAFPTAEMRDAFYENFKELIDKCKELL